MTINHDYLLSVASFVLNVLIRWEKCVFLCFLIMNVLTIVYHGNIAATVTDKELLVPLLCCSGQSFLALDGFGSPWLHMWLLFSE